MRAGGAHAGARCAHGGPGGTGVGSVAWRGSRVGGQLRPLRRVENRAAWTSLIIAFVA